MAATSQTAKFSIDLQSDVSSVAKDDANSLESLRQKVNGSQESLKAMSSALRNLRGSTEEVKAAKDSLKAKINAAKDAISANTLAINKQGTSLDALNKKHADLGKQAEEAAKAEAKRKKEMGESKDLLETLRGKFSDLGGASGIAMAGAAGLAAAVVGLSVAVVSGLVSLTKWVVAGADAARTMALMREGALGSARDAGALGSQIDALAAKVPLARDKLNDIGLTLHRAGIGGQTLVDSMQAIAGASAGLDDSAGAQLKALVERGKLTQRFQVGRLELQGSGIDFKGLSEKLAKNLGVSIQSAQKALAEGRVKLSDGAKAMADAVDERFGATNKKKLLGLDVQSLRLRESLAKLTDGVNIEPLLEGVSRLVAMFSDSTVTGSALKTVITLVGNAISSVLVSALPIAEKGFKRLVIAGLDVTIMALRAKKTFEDWLSRSNLGKVDLLGVAMTVAKVAAANLAVSAAAIGTVIGVSVGSAIVQLDLLVGAFNKVSALNKSIFSVGKGIDFSTMGRDMVDGLIRGLTDGLERVKSAVKGLATAARDTFKQAMGIRSPSTVMADEGEQLPAGAAVGVRRGTPKLEDAVDAMATVPSMSAQGSSFARYSPGATISLVFHITGSDAENIKRTIESSDVMGKIVEAVDMALATAAVPQ